jgi:predicted DNA-binding transcriptional regulator YafY
VSDLTPTARILQLLSLLQTHRFWPGGELARRLGVSDRTLRRDVERLRQLGYPVDGSPGVAGGYRMAAGAHLPPLVLDDDEAVAIAVGLRAAAGASVAGIEETAVRALAKLQHVLPDHLRRRVNAVHAHITPLRWGEPRATVDADALAVLAQACRDREEVRFEYQRRDGDESRRLVEPHRLVSAGYRWYLVAWDVRRAAWRTFRLDRLRSPQLAGVRFAERPLPAADAAAFVAQSLASMPMPYNATLRVHGPVDEVRARLRWADAEVEAGDDGSCAVRLRAETGRWLTTMAAMLAVDFELAVDDPPDLAADVRALADRLARA